ncbi:MAG TPA: cation diffusion facilitator family transporter, partial [Anaerolineaceae bacterium]|nr:cation diffusion facilitator family transporter [Anaerolineaceae bacterium]
SSGIEGTLILVASASIIYTAVERILNPKPLEQLGIGLLVSVIASLANLVVSLILQRAGKKHNSISLASNGKHLMTDVWTSGGVLLGVAAVALTKWALLDSIVAILVAINIIWTGVGIVRRSVSGLMDSALPQDEVAKIKEIVQKDLPANGKVHALRTRQSAAVKFISMHILVPGDWTVSQGHALVSKIENEILAAHPDSLVFTHVEPLDTPAAHEQSILSEYDF